MTGALAMGTNAFGGSYLSVSSGGVTQWGASRGIMTWDTGYASIYGNGTNVLKLGGHGDQGRITIGDNVIALTAPLTTNSTIDGIDIATDVAANTLKATNVAGNLGVTANGTSLTVTTTNGTNIAIPAATAEARGIMTPELVAAISANTAKETNEGEPDAEEGTRGIIALATVEEATGGSDEVKAVTSVGVLQSIITRKVHELAAPTSALAMNSQKVTGVANPTAAQDVATKAYVDGARVQQIVNLKGYATLQNDVYDYANPYNTDDEAPFQFDVSYGSGTINSSTEVNQSKLFRSGGFHVPFSCTVSSIQAQLTCNNDGNVSIALVEYRPSDAAGDTSDYPRVVYETVVVDSANNNNKVSSTTIAVGDLDNTAVPAGSHLMIMVKGDGTTAGGTAVFSVAIGLSW
jgi:hypothetical protein